MISCFDSLAALVSFTVTDACVLSFIVFYFHFYKIMAAHGFTRVAVMVAGVAGHGVTRFIVGVYIHGVHHSNDLFCCCTINQKYEERSNFESSYSNNFAKAEEVVTKPRRHGAITYRFTDAKVDQFAGRLL